MMNDRLRRPAALRALAALPALAALGALLAACGAGPAPDAGSCDLGQSPCAAPTALGGVTLALAPRPIAPMTALQVTVDAGTPLDEVTLELAGRDMDMGPNAVRLAAQSALRWRGTATIPLCLSGRMDWTATLRLRRGAQVERIRFGFQAG